MTSLSNKFFTKLRAGEIPFYARIASSDGNHEVSMDISDVSIDNGKGKKELIQHGVKLSSGATRGKKVPGAALLSIDTTKPSENFTQTSGSGRVEQKESTCFPKIEVGTKKERRARNATMFANARIVHQDDENIDYFDIVFDKKAHKRDGSSPHVGFRPTGSGQFIKASSNIDIEILSIGKLTLENGCILPEKIEINVPEWSMKIHGEFEYKNSLNTLILKKIYFS